MKPFHHAGSGVSRFLTSRLVHALGKQQIFIRKTLALPKSVEGNEAKKRRGDESVVTDSPAAACPGR